MEALASKEVQLKSQVSQMQDRYQEMMRIKGKLDAQEQAHEVKKKELKREQTILAEQYGLSESYKPSEFAQELTDVERGEVESLEDHRRRSAAADSEQENKIAAVQQKQIRASEAIAQHEETRRTNVARLQSIAVGLKECVSKMGVNSDVSEELEQAEKELRELESIDKSPELQSQVQSTQEEIRTNTAKISKLTEERRSLQSQQQQLSQLQYKRDELEKARAEHNQLLGELLNSLAASGFSLVCSKSLAC